MIKLKSKKSIAMYGSPFGRLDTSSSSCMIFLNQNIEVNFYSSAISCQSLKKQYILRSIFPWFASRKMLGKLFILSQASSVICYFPERCRTKILYQLLA